jgi:hypothetical protein
MTVGRSPGSTGRHPYGCGQPDAAEAVTEGALRRKAPQFEHFYQPGPAPPPHHSQPRWRDDREAGGSMIPTRIPPRPARVSFANASDPNPSAAFQLPYPTRVSTATNRPGPCSSRSPYNGVNEEPPEEAGSPGCSRRAAPYHPGAGSLGIAATARRLSQPIAGRSNRQWTLETARGSGTGLPRTRGRPLGEQPRPRHSAGVRLRDGCQHGPGLRRCLHRSAAGSFAAAPGYLHSGSAVVSLCVVFRNLGRLH